MSQQPGMQPPWVPPSAAQPPGQAGPPGVPASYPPVVAPPPPEGRWKPAKVEPFAGTAFGVVHLEIPAVTSGPAIGSLISGIAALLVSVLVLCLGVAGAGEGWGAWVAGAFTVLGTAAGAGAVGVGLVGLRQIRRSDAPGQMRFTGRGMAIAGISCGAAGLGICLLALALVVVVQVV